MTDSRWRRCAAAGAIIAAALGPVALGGDVAGAQGGPAETTTTAPPGTTTTAPATTTTAPATTTTAAPPPATTAPATTAAPPQTTAAVVESATTARPTATTAKASATTAKTTSTTTRKTTTTAAARSTTTAKGASGPQSSVVVPTAAADPKAADGQRSRRAVHLIVGLLCVVGLLIATLTWRYFWFTDPKRGLSRSRAMLADHVLAADDPDTGVIRVWHDGEVGDGQDGGAAGARRSDPVADPAGPSDTRRPAPSGSRRRTPAHRRSRRS